MSDDQFLPDDEEYTDNDVPFRLPKSEDYEEDEDIHKADTETIDIPPALREVKPPEEASVLYRPRPSGRDTNGSHNPIPDPAREEHAASSPPASGADDDVPFRLPISDEDDFSQDTVDRNVGHKFVTMPNNPMNRNTPGYGANTVPNPPQQRPATPPTVQKQPAVPANPSAADHQRYQRPNTPAPTNNAPPYYGAPPMPPGQTATNTRPPLPRRRTRRRPRNIGCLAIFIGLLVTFCGGLTLVLTVGGVYAYARVGDLLSERLAQVDEYEAFQSTFYYDRDGRQLYEVFNEGRRTNVSIAQMPEHLLEATIAIEDDSFYRNIGVDIPATTVAFLSYLGAASDEQTAGGSTITQQLVRNVLFDPEYRAERSAQRKAEEILLAVAMTSRKSKDEILELYLNEIYYGNLAYGAQAASQVFFGKDVSELTLGEAALLAGLPQIPAELDPFSPDPDIQAAVNRRWRQVLQEMTEEGFITAEERDQALRDGLTYRPQDVPLRAPHFTVFAQGEFEALMTEIGYSVEDVARGGWQVYTTIDLDINEMVQQITRDQVASLAGNNISNGAVVVLSPVTGEILAMVGSIDYNNDAIDGRVNVTTALRQPGSTVKAFTYAAALERGWSTLNLLWDTRTQIGVPGQEPYVPRNYDGGFHGPMRMRTALANSYNIPAVQTLRFVGVDYLLAFLQRLGVESLGTDASRFGLSLTLGGGEISPLELTRGFGVFANDGVLVPSAAIRCVIDNDNQIIFEYENGCPRGERTDTTVIRGGFGSQVLDPRIAYFISDVLADNAARSPAMGSNSDLNTGNLRSSVKTGTTGVTEIKDNWAVGFTRNVAVGVWVGNNNGDPLRNSSGLTGAAPIWNRVITSIYNNQTMLEEFAVEGQLRNDQADVPAGMRVANNLCNVQTLRPQQFGCSGSAEWVFDSPAAVPDGNGGFTYPPVPAQENFGPNSTVLFVEPGVYRAVVRPIAPEIAASIRFDVPPGEPAPPPPIFCRVPANALAITPDAAEYYFLAPPPVASDAAQAEQYARSNNLAFLPTIECTSELLNAPVGGGIILTAVITSPQPNETFSSTTPISILGTAQFSSQQAAYYKVDIRGGQWGDWTTIGATHNQAVVNGVLESLPALPSGRYELRLTIVGLDGNDVQPGYVVPFNVQ
ncbi:MAG: hypothetical protein OHK0046_22610 [Anaerolineae bacterium]